MSAIITLLILQRISDQFFRKQMHLSASHLTHPELQRGWTIPFSRGSSEPRDWTLVSYIAGRFFTTWATGEACKGDELGLKKDTGKTDWVLAFQAVFDSVQTRKKKAFTLNTYVNVAFHPCSRDHAGGGIVAKSCLTLEALWTVARQAPLSMGFSRQEYWSGLPFPSPGDLADSGIEPRSPALQADSLPTELWGKPLGTINKFKVSTTSSVRSGLLSGCGGYIYTHIYTHTHTWNSSRVPYMGKKRCEKTERVLVNSWPRKTISQILNIVGKGDHQGSKIIENAMGLEQNLET